ncbi:MAG TPA: hypothetical protein VF179_30745 [Thermoanaerobaculia bacterium]|nr:hypothetical protein [Thermoanaerobaculia bacterium]
MIQDPIVEELHRHREELFREFGNDPEALVKYLQEKERGSGRLVQSPPPPGSAARRTRIARR